MGIFQNPVGGQPNDPYEKYRAEAIEREKHAKEEPEQEPEETPKTRSIIGAYLLLLLRRFLDLFEAAPQKKISTLTDKEIRKNLLFLKAAFEMLKIEDRSQDIGFLNRLSELWHQALEDGIRLKKSTPAADKLRSLLRKIQQYPENQEYSLGYYLTEYAGQKWVPFPYMEMIQKMHVEHQKNPDSSAMNAWTSQLDEICALLNRD